MNKKILAMAMAGVMAVSTAVTSFADGTTREVSNYSDLLNALAEEGVTRIVLTTDVEIDKMLDIQTPNITLDLGGNTLSASDSFDSTWGNHNDAHLVQVYGAEGVTITNGSLVATAKNKHVLNVYNADNVTIGGLTLDHKNAGYDGAPLVVNNSDVTVDDELELVTGTNSWYGINVDPKAGSAAIAFEPNAVVKMTFTAGELNAMQLDGETSQITVTTPENAGLKMTAEGVFVSDPSVIPSYDEDEESERSTGDYFGNEKWAEVKREIAAAEEGDVIEMSATGLPWFPSSVARALKGRDITLEVRKNGVTYSINGLEIGAIEKIWYEFDQIETELLTAEAPESK